MSSRMYARKKRGTRVTNALRVPSESRVIWPVVSSFAIVPMLQSNRAAKLARLQLHIFFICFNKLSRCQRINYQDMLLLEQGSPDKNAQMWGETVSAQMTAGYP